MYSVFLAFVLFTTVFLANLSEITAPLYRLIRKDTTFTWDNSAKTAFERLRQQIMHLPTLAFLDPNSPFDLHTDTTNYGLGAVLVQNARPIAFASRTLSAAEKNYSTTEKECLAIVWALKYFHPYIYGATFTIYSDHAALKAILTTKMPRGRIARWILDIQSYRFSIIHRKGSEMIDADTLGRLTSNHQEHIELTTTNFRHFQQEDPLLQPYFHRLTPPFRIINSLLYRQGIHSPNYVPVIPRKLVPTILHQAHDSLTGGHVGRDKTLDKAMSLGWWPYMRDDIDRWVNSCEACQRFKPGNNKIQPPLTPILPSQAGEIWAADVAIFPRTHRGNQYVMVFMEYLTRWAATAALPSFDSHHTAQVLLYEVVL